MPSPADRIWDAAALIFVACGIGVFAVARQSLTSIAAGSYEMPVGMSAVAQTDLLVAQTQLGMFVIGVGVVIGVIAAVRHARRPKPASALIPPA